MMRKLALPFAAAALFVGGCTAEHDIAQNTASSSPDRQAIAPGARAKAQAAKIRSAATLPDRGTLLRYRSDLAAIRRQAETYRAVDLSEAHALNAAKAGKSIELPTPSGETMHIGFVRMEESIDGNWSWVGRTADGLDAVITFGEKAVFGRIAQRNTEALRLTTLAGRTWLVETDPSRLNDGNLLRDAKRTDMVVPPSTVASILARKRAAASAKVVTTANASVAPADTVDVVLGYTSGLVTKYGGDTAANTRLANLIALTNQAYLNSQINGRVRLVRTVAVTYTDSNSNDTALDALTGKTCTTSGCTDITVPAELVPLRTARDTYGGDLVSLVRPFQAPQQGSCGVGWLLGGGGFTIDNTDAPFAYSVASDGSDVDETDGRNYFCREETLAHELGHNMGQQHNVEDSGGDGGTHTYSYGYREASTTGFYTIMAYRLANSSQFSITNFANPNVNYADTGRPTGTAATNDNARSMNASMPLVAQFRANVLPFAGKVHNDLNGDGRSDLLWFNTGSSSMAYWWMNSTAVLGTGLSQVGSTFRIAGTGDLDGDGRTDIIWRDNATNYHYLWRSRGDGTYDTPFLGAVGTGWAVSRTADINGDGRDDIVWENTTTGQMAYWLMNGATTTGTGVFSVGTAYRIVGAGDFDGDGKGDLLWANASSGYLYLWRSRGDGTFDTPFVAAYGTTWNVAGIADINGDGKSDIVWEEPTQGLMAYWLMNGATTTSTGLRSVGTAYRIATTGDLDGDGKGDIVWANASAGYLYLWRSQGNGNFDTPFLAAYGTTWSLLP